MIDLGDGSSRSSLVAPPARRWSDLGVRAASGLVLIVVALVTARIGGPLFLAVWVVASIVVLWEWQRLIGGRWQDVGFLGGALALVVIGLAARSSYVTAICLVMLVSAGQAALAIPGRRIWAAGGMLYSGLFLLAVVALRFSFPFGGRSIVWLFATVWSTDMFAYFGGRLIGGRKLWPRVSPSKTWSGTICGVVAGALIGTSVAMRDLPSASALMPILLLSLVAAILSQAGDAFESGIKRYFGVKDSSRLIPGHGGVMDRLDGFIAAAIFAFTFGLLRNLPSVASGLFYWA